MTGPASAVVRRVPCPPRTRLGGPSPYQRRLADHVAHEPLRWLDSRSPYIRSCAGYAGRCSRPQRELDTHVYVSVCAQMTGRWPESHPYNKQRFHNRQRKTGSRASE